MSFPFFPLAFPPSDHFPFHSRFNDQRRSILETVLLPDRPAVPASLSCCRNNTFRPSTIDFLDSDDSLRRLCLASISPSPLPSPFPPTTATSKLCPTKPAFYGIDEAFTEVIESNCGQHQTNHTTSSSLSNTTNVRFRIRGSLFSILTGETRCNTSSLPLPLPHPWRVHYDIRSIRFDFIFTFDSTLDRPRTRQES